MRQWKLQWGETRSPQGWILAGRHVSPRELMDFTLKSALKNGFTPYRGCQGLEEDKVFRIRKFVRQSVLAVTWTKRENCLKEQLIQKHSSFSWRACVCALPLVTVCPLQDSSSHLPWKWLFLFRPFLFCRHVLTSGYTLQRWSNVEGGKMDL